MAVFQFFFESSDEWYDPCFTGEAKGSEAVNIVLGASRLMKRCDEVIKRTLELVDLMNEIADDGDKEREDVGCGVLYGVLRDSAYKIKKLAEDERQAHIRKGWWKADKAKPPKKC